MTPAQLATLKSYILADPVLSQKPMNSDGDFDIAVILNNTLASPTFYVWRTVVPISEIMQNGFDWTRVDNQTVGEARIWQYMTQLGSINPNQANVRAGINESFKGTAQDDTMRLAIYGHCYVKATVAQKIFATGTGAVSDKDGIGPGTVVVESVTAEDVRQARTS